MAPYQSDSNTIPEMSQEGVGDLHSQGRKYGIGAGLNLNRPKKMGEEAQGENDF